MDWVEHGILVILLLNVARQHFCISQLQQDVFRQDLHIATLFDVDELNLTKKESK